MKTSSCIVFGAIGFAGLLAAPNAASALLVSGGTANITILEGNAASISELDAYFNNATTRAQTLSLPAPGNLAFTESPADPSVGTISLVDTIRPFGEVPLNDAGGTTPGAPGASRTRQATTLDFDPANVLGSWTASNDGFGIFVGNSVVGEQIAFTGMQRYTGPFGGVLIYGDFALRYVPGRDGAVSPGGLLSGLVLTSNIDFLHSAWADIANASIAFSNNTLNITGDLLISGALNVLDQTAVIGTKFGTISITANVPASIPEPASLGLIALGSLLVGRRRMARD